MRLIFALCLLFPPLFSAEPAKDWATVQSEPQRIFKIYTTDGKTNWCATAFAISEHRLLTAAHTFEHTAKQGYIEHYIYIDGKREPVAVAKIDYKTDICLVECSTKTFSFYEIGSWFKGEAATAIGFIGEQKTISTEHEASIKSSGSLLKAKGLLHEGMSGGPLLDDAGRVIGMHKKGDDHNSYFVPAEALKAFSQQ